MQGAISNIEAVGRWFKANESPFFTLSYYSTQSPTGQGAVIGRNTKEADVEIAWQRLKTYIQDQTGYGRAQLHLIVYDKASGANTPSGRTNIDILSNGQQQSGTQGIGSIPGGYMDEAKIRDLIANEREKWDMERRIEDLEEQIVAPNDWMDKLMAGIERIGATPFGQALATKYLGAPAVAGTPNTDNTNTPDSDDVEKELDILESIAAQHGMTLKEFLAKTANLAQQQPGMVQMLAKQ